MKAYLVVNPTADGAGDTLRTSVEKQCADRGWEPPTVLETSTDGDGPPGAQEAARAVAEGADLVLSYGGDGTVRAVVCGLAGSGVPLGILPAGTGNLLARNLEMPLDVDEALTVAFDGVDRPIDVGRTGDKGECFVVMAGLGFDAQMMADAPTALKHRVGWLAYLVSGARHLRGESHRVTLTLDDKAPIVRHARMVLVGNVGTLQGGLDLLPDAVPDDGTLDLVVLSPTGFTDWVRVVSRLIRRSKDEDSRVERFRAREVRIDVRHGWEAQLDGDPMGKRRSMTASVEPGALVIRVPREEQDRR